MLVLSIINSIFSPSPVLRELGVNWKFQASDNGLVFSVINPYPRAHL